MPSRGGGRGGARGPLPREVQVSKKLSWLLRHGAEKEGLTLGEGGFINLQDVLANRNLRSLKVTYDEVRQIVQENDKQRFTLVPNAANGSPATTVEGEITTMTSDNPADYMIRANQGHSLKVESEGLLKPLDNQEELPTTVVHGTTHAAWTLIEASGGLKPMGRNHIHFAAGLPAGFKSVVDEESAKDGAAPVISGMRKSSTVLIFLNMQKAVDAGVKFWVSDNGVILTEGNEKGLVPLSVFKRVEDRTGEGVLLHDGVIVKETPLHWAAKAKSKG